MKKIWTFASIAGTCALGIGLVASFPVSFAKADATGASPSATITVIGHSEQQVKPDIAMIGAGVMSNGKDAESAQNMNDKAMKKVMDALASAKIPANDVQTQWYSIQPSYGPPDKEGRPQMDGFQAVTSFQVTVRDLASVGNIVDTLVKSGANQINNVQYQVSSPLSFEEKAYDSAIANAKSQAANIAQSLGVTISGIQSVDATNQNDAVPIFKEASASSATNGPILSPGTQSIDTNVKVVYTISNSNG
jgi:uncharacterized protein